MKGEAFLFWLSIAFIVFGVIACAGGSSKNGGQVNQIEDSYLEVIVDSSRGVTCYEYQGNLSCVVTRPSGN